MKCVISVSKTYKHRGLRIHKPSTKKYWHIYGFEVVQNEPWKFFCEQVSSIKAKYHKLNLYHKIIRYCPYCLTPQLCLVKKKNEKINCINCFEEFEL